MNFLGRATRRETDGYSWEADRKHVKLLLAEQQMEDCKMIELPLAKCDSDEPQVDRNSLEPMATKEAT